MCLLKLTQRVSDEPINAYNDVFLPEPRQQPLAGTLTTGATIRAEKDHAVCWTDEGVGRIRDTYVMVMIFSLNIAKPVGTNFLENAIFHCRYAE